MGTMDKTNDAGFDASLLCAGYEEKTSLTRYKELRRNFPNTLILFGHDGYYYGFDETAVALSKLFGYHYKISGGMLVARSVKIELMITKFQARGLRYIIDEDGRLTFGAGKGFKLQKPLSYYEAHPIIKRAEKARNTSWTESDSKQGGGWNNDNVWTPGLPSSRFYKSKK